MERKNLIIGGVLLILAGTSWWLAERTGVEESDSQADEHTPDYFLEGFTGVKMDASGKPEQKLVAQRLTHYPDDDSTELKQPRLTLYDEGRPPWRVRSETGWMSGDGEVLLLQGVVNIDRSAAPGVRPTHIITRDLRVQPRDNYLESDAEVHMRSLNDRLDAKGMQIWYSKPVRIKLLANVRGYYEGKL